MKSILLSVLVSLVLLLTLVVFRWITLPVPAKENLLLEIASRHYYSFTNIELADFEEINKIVIYSGFFSFDDVINTEATIDLMTQHINEKILNEELADPSIDLFNREAYFYNHRGDLIGIATEREGKWEMLIKNGRIYSDKIDKVLNKKE